MAADAVRELSLVSYEVSEAEADGWTYVSEAYCYSDVWCVCVTVSGCIDGSW